MAKHRNGTNAEQGYNGRQEYASVSAHCPTIKLCFRDRHGERGGFP